MDTPQTSRNPPPNTISWLAGHIIPFVIAVVNFVIEFVATAFDEDWDEDDDEDENDDDHDHKDDEVGDHEDDEDGDHDDDSNDNDTQLDLQRTEAKQSIKQLIMQETFTREECDSLVKALNLRVTDGPTGAGEDSLLDGSPKSDGSGIIFDPLRLASTIIKPLPASVMKEPLQMEEDEGSEDSDWELVKRTCEN